MACWAELQFHARRCGGECCAQAQIGAQTLAAIGRNRLEMKVMKERR